MNNEFRELAVEPFVEDVKFLQTKKKDVCTPMDMEERIMMIGLMRQFMTSAHELQYENMQLRTEIIQLRSKLNGAKLEQKRASAFSKNTKRIYPKQNHAQK